jgi:hypothetical protein
MATEIAGMFLRLQKMFQPTVHVFVPQMLFSYMVSTVVKERPSPTEANRELFRLGLWGGSVAMLKFSKTINPKDIWPKSFDVGKFTSYAKLNHGGAWYLFAGHMPEINVEARGQKFIWITLRELPGKETFYKIETPEGVDVWYFLAGSYEGAALTLLRLVGEEEKYFTMWRPLPSRDGIEGFYAIRDLGPAEVIRTCNDLDPGFFKLVSWEDSAKFAEELFGIKIPLLV